MKNKWVKLILQVLLCAVVVNVGSAIGGSVGNIITIIGGVGVIVAIVMVFKKQPTENS